MVTQQQLEQMQQLARQLGFRNIGVSSIDLHTTSEKLQQWLQQQFHGTMEYMHKHGSKRWHPEQLVEGTMAVISVAIDYLPEPQQQAWQTLEQSEIGYISRYALGRDYHKLLRRKLEQFAQQLQTIFGSFSYRVFVDSAPVMEKPIAVQAGLGWIGKHTNLIHQNYGSWCFLGEIYTSIELSPSVISADHCGNCQRCIDICPTRAIVAPYLLDARRCISYLTIEHHGAIPVEFRKDIGNRIYGCDDCQLVCPWNRFAQLTTFADFQPRHNLDRVTLQQLWSWSETEFNQRTEGMAIRRIGFERWQRNLAVALGNSKLDQSQCQQLQQQLSTCSVMVAEHIDWALQQQT